MPPGMTALLGKACENHARSRHCGAILDIGSKSQTQYLKFKIASQETYSKLFSR